MFINNLPNGKGYQSVLYGGCQREAPLQAANVIEGMESGTSLFLIDEDTCATNFDDTRRADAARGLPGRGAYHSLH